MNQTSISQKVQEVIPAEIREKLKPSTKFKVKSVSDTVVFSEIEYVLKSKLY